MEAFSQSSTPTQLYVCKVWQGKNSHPNKIRLFETSLLWLKIPILLRLYNEKSKLAKGLLGVLATAQATQELGEHHVIRFTSLFLFSRETRQRRLARRALPLLPFVYKCSSVYCARHITSKFWCQPSFKIDYRSMSVGCASPPGALPVCQKRRPGLSEGHNFCFVQWCQGSPILPCFLNSHTREKPQT